MGGLMDGKRGLIMGVANDHSIAWGIARAVAAQGAELAFTYQSEALGRRVKPLADKVGSKLVMPCDVEDVATVADVFATIGSEWGGLDFAVHAIGFTDRTQLKGRYVDVTTRENFVRTMVISAYSFTEMAQHAAPLLNEGASLLTLTYGGSIKVMPNYNVMGVAKAALEASMRYLAADFGNHHIRVNALSAGPMRTLAGSGVSDARLMYNFQQKNSPLGRAINLDDIGGAGLYLLSDLSSGVTGEVHYVDSGYNIMSMPRLDELRRTETI
ncbi:MULTISPECIES: enoyl-ACP reductase FabI [unclassified Roseitalea]|uniref:enoyl-ACP reductase FabI n=1 Tax=unclassified Roseitalea TaxID=2639107 RepID=UPI00273D96EA|nr:MULTISPECIES: enoyl-ACP reductase FabI [unclassified Roseitalea]